jgi:NADPH2:quinone reductase
MIMSAQQFERRIVVTGHGGPERLQLQESPIPPPGRGEVRVRQRAIGVNFVDIYFRTGAYPLPALPSGIGVEAAGTVEAIGEGVDPAWLGRRVAYAGPPVGAYASARNVPVAMLARLPAGIAGETAAAVLLRGLTAYMLFAHVRPLSAGDTVLVHAAAGGLGLVLSQWAHSLGARVVGTVSSEEKAALARAHGTDRTILYPRQDFVAATREFTDGRGADFVVDGIGGDTFARSLDALAPFGMAASIGQVAGEVTAIDLTRLHPSRSISISRPGVFRLLADPARYRAGCEAVFERLADGLDVRIGERLPLEEAAAAHRALESGRSTGSLLLIP